MSDSYGIYAVSDDDQPVVDALTSAFAFPGVPDPGHDDGKTVTFTVPGRQAVLWRGDVDDPDVSERQLREVFVWGGGDTNLGAALDVIDALRARGLAVIIDEEHPDLIAADAARGRRILTTRAASTRG